jgi:hypothetical protein
MSGALGCVAGAFGYALRWGSRVELVLHIADDAWAIATYGPCIIVVWRGQPTRRRIEAGFVTLRAHAEAVGAPVHIIVVIEDGSPAPGADDLPLVHDAFESVADRVATAVAVMETQDPAARDVKVAAEAVSGTMAPRIVTKLCFDTAEACAWLAPRRTRADSPPDRRALERIIERVRGSITAPAATV